MPRKKNNIKVKPNTPKTIKGKTKPKILIDWQEFDYLCTIHCTLNEIAGFFGCSEDTIENRVKEVKKVRFSDYYKQKASHGKIAIRRAMFQGLKDKNTSLTIWLSKQHLGMSDNPETAIEEDTKLNIDKWK